MSNCIYSNCRAQPIDGMLYCDKHINFRNKISKKASRAKKAVKKVAKKRP